MKKLTMLFALAVTLLVAADFQRTGKPRDLSFQGMKLKVVRVDSTWRICEDVPLFSSVLAELPYPDSLLNYAEHRNLAIAVARTIATEFGSTNDLRVARRVAPARAATNLADVVDIWLNTKDITEDVVPLFTPCTVQGATTKGNK